MNRVFGKAIFCLLMIAPTAALASPVELANIQYPLLGMTHFQGGFTGYKLYVDDGSFRLFENLTFGLGHSSGTFNADGSTDPDFAGFAANLTNGIDNVMTFWGSFDPIFPGCGCDAGVVGGEFALFGGHDFLGRVITRVVLQIDSLDVSSPSQGPSSASIAARFIIEGEPAASVNEPSTIHLLGGGLVALVGLFRSRRRA